MTITSKTFEGRHSWSNAKDFVNSASCKRVLSVSIIYEE